MGFGEVEGAHRGGALRTGLLVGDGDAGVGTMLRPFDRRDAVLVPRLPRVDPLIVHLDPALLERVDNFDPEIVAQSGPLSFVVSLSSRAWASLSATHRLIIDLISPGFTNIASRR